MHGSACMSARSSVPRTDGELSEMPFYIRRSNPFLQSRHRVNHMTLRHCLTSLFTLHNESVNIWRFFFFFFFFKIFFFLTFPPPVISLLLFFSLTCWCRSTTIRSRCARTTWCLPRIWPAAVFCAPFRPFTTFSRAIQSVCTILSFAWTLLESYLSLRRPLQSVCIMDFIVTGSIAICT